MIVTGKSSLGFWMATPDVQEDEHAIHAAIGRRVVMCIDYGPHVPRSDWMVSSGSQEKLAERHFTTEADAALWVETGKVPND